MKKNVIWINSACVALSLAMVLAVIPAPAEANGTINYFTANPTTITLGEYTELSWDISGGEDTIVFLSAYGVDIHRGAAHVAKVMMKPEKTTTYTLRVETWDDDGNVTSFHER